MTQECVGNSTPVTTSCTATDICDTAPSAVSKSGTDKLITPLSVSQLQGRGVTVRNFETVVIDTSKRYLSPCF